MENNERPPRPEDRPGHTWVFDHDQQEWKEVEREIIMPGGRGEDEAPGNWPVDITPPPKPNSN